MLYEDTLNNIKDFDKKYFNACNDKWNKVAKPLHSLGKLEDLISKIGQIQQTSSPKINKRRVLVFCSDNGVVEEGVSQSDHTITTAVAESMILDQSNINIFSRIAHADVEVYDVGMIDDINNIDAKNYFLVDKTCKGTNNLAKEPAMSRESCIHAIECGIKAVQKAYKDGCDVVVIGEMGIGNTTTSAALVSILLDISPEDVAGRGSGLSDKGLLKKINAIKKCMVVNKPDVNDPIDVLSKAGGFDICGMCGVILGAASIGIPVILDGFISGVAALAAYFIDKRSGNVLIPSHISKEPGGRVVLDHLKLHGVIDANMALGEGTGGAALLPLLDMAFAVYYSSHSFESLNMDAYTEQK